MKHSLFRNISKIHSVKYHVACKLYIGCGSLSLMEMLPCPYACFFFCLKPLAFRCDKRSRMLIRSFRAGSLTLKLLIPFYIYKSNITLVSLGYFIQKLKNPFSSCKSHDYCIELLADLVDGHVHALIKSKETCQVTDGQCQYAGSAVEHKYAAYYGTEHIAQVS